MHLQRMIQNTFDNVNGCTSKLDDSLDQEEAPRHTTFSVDFEDIKPSMQDQHMEDNQPTDNLEFENLMDNASEPLYTGCKVSKLSATLLLYNLKVVHGWSQASMDELLHLLKKDILPEENELPPSTYHAKKMIKDLGLHYNSIHACVNDCILYRGEHSILDSCPICGASRWKEGKRKIPQKVLRHFPLIPRLLRMYRCSNFL